MISCSNNHKIESKSTPTIPDSTDASARVFKDNVLMSQKDPHTKIKLLDEFIFVGRFDFKIKPNPEECEQPELLDQNIAGGERFVFVDDSIKIVKRLIVVQFEGFLENNSMTYNYNFDDAMKIGKTKFRNNPWFYNDSILCKENPNSEASKTRQLIQDNGFTLSNELMMTRFVTVTDSTRRNEMIIYYIEMAKDWNFNISDYEQNKISQKRVERIAEELKEKALKSFSLDE
jgi:hypothetical protein